ncbi:MAG TPA: hypothetical protein DCS93_19105 [Microscillaceae bacterium]|nr:hypothetical protein [Microscillaceae bacterium]
MSASHSGAHLRCVPLLEAFVMRLLISQALRCFKNALKALLKIRHSLKMSASFSKHIVTHSGAHLRCVPFLEAFVMQLLISQTLRCFKNALQALLKIRHSLKMSASHSGAHLRCVPFLETFVMRLLISQVLRCFKNALKALLKIRHSLKMSASFSRHIVTHSGAHLRCVPLLEAFVMRLLISQALRCFKNALKALLKIRHSLKMSASFRYT